MTVTIDDMTLGDMVSDIRDLMNTKYPLDPVKHQQVIELLVVQHAARMSDLESALLVADGINKHAKQLIRQWMKEKP